MVVTIFRARFDGESVQRANIASVVHLHYREMSAGRLIVAAWSLPVIKPGEAPLPPMRSAYTRRPRRDDRDQPHDRGPCRPMPADLLE
jgi:hypothetical protein